LNKPANLEIVPLTADDRQWVREFIATHWGSPEIVVHDTRYLPEELPGCKAVLDGNPIGLITWAISGKECEIVSLDSLLPEQGIGAALLTAAEDAAQAAGCQQITLVTTNDNLLAHRFYTKRGYRFTRLDKGAVNKSRKVKPQIPLVNEYGLPIRDEVTFTRKL
jgi:GNAT superfamily N-acetyltransferase